MLVPATLRRWDRAAALKLRRGRYEHGSSRNVAKPDMNVVFVMDSGKGTAMTRVRRLVLDVLKPHQPNIVELGKLLAAEGELRVSVSVLEVDARTETVQIEVLGDDIDFEGLREAVEGFGASLHSVDEIEVDNVAD